MVANSSNRGFQIPTVGGDAGVWGNELNATINSLDSMLGGSLTFLTSVAVTVTLSTAGVQYGRIVMGGIPASSMTLYFTSTIAYGNYNVWNATSTASGSFNVTCAITSTSSGSEVLIPQGNMRMVNVDGQNVQYADQVVIPVTSLPPVLNGYISGLTLSYNSSTVLNIAKGIAADTTQTTYLQSAAAFTKTASGAWVAGSGNGGMGSGLSMTAATSYHIFIISNGTSSNIDFYFDVSVTAVNKPAGTNYFRRIGSFLTDSASAAWPHFYQWDNRFYLNDTPIIFNVGSQPYALVTVSGLPTGIIMQPMLAATADTNPGPGSFEQLMGPAAASSAYQVVTTGGAATAAVTGNQAWAGDGPASNTSAQVYLETTLSGGGSNGQWSVNGWVDCRDEF